ncbi:MAG: tyrosine-type recombinase/integrase [Catenulispora sp.]
MVEASGPGAQRTYGNYWTRILDVFGDRRLDEVSATDLEALMRQVVRDRTLRRNGREGVSAGEHLLMAARAMYRRAVADELIDAARNPAARVAKPRRPPTTRRGLSPEELAAINRVIASSGNDTALDCLLIRLHLETACRRGAALKLRDEDLDETWSLVRLREKNNAERWQPVSPSLMHALLEHGRERGAGAAPDRQLLRYRSGNPITRRRYDHLWERVGSRLPWAAAQNISTHWLRHTTLTWVERHFGYGIARAYAGHTDSPGPATTTYIRATLREIATALTALTQQPHPLASAHPSAGSCPSAPSSAVDAFSVGVASDGKNAVVLPAE